MSEHLALTPYSSGLQHVTAYEASPIRIRAIYAMGVMAKLKKKDHQRHKKSKAWHKEKLFKKIVPLIIYYAFIHRRSPRTQQDFDQVIPGFELTDEHAFGSREKLGDAHGNCALPVVDDLVCIVGESTLQPSLHDLP